MNRLINVFALVLLAILASCNNADLSKNNEEHSKVRENVWAYVQSTEMPQGEEWKNAWLNGKIEERKLEGNIVDYSNLPDKYHGETVFFVTPSFNTEPVAYPTILVNPETREVIGEIPGE